MSKAIGEEIKGVKQIMPMAMNNPSLNRAEIAAVIESNSQY
ncbi:MULTISPECIES: hypothetical protein [unclassified Shewanella]|nr:MULTISPECIES: hypothetical protein [unclassified Shewanella]MDO6639543.1 hypothetical protein [Shewanella sp. 5_MG-2023]